MDPDYKQCTLAELYDVEENINKQRYPQRYSALMQEIAYRKQNPDAEPKPEPINDNEESQVEWMIMFLFFMIIVYASFVLIDAYLTGVIRGKHSHIYHIDTSPQGYYRTLSIYALAAVGPFLIIVNLLIKKLFNK
ncbi:hypothetical protein TUM4261_07900 [Shewanella sp. c952]|uniref:hypothetical protein n=1 Tax=Shewanella sp. c952 TaxID=2815913 RepID=UPI001BBE3173|nr:hypothetical protein [Shewanella sp. c952]GIU05644.1 hypothetical protein TUM4261_07900 [Shewanella sp. c952]